MSRTIRSIVVVLVAAGLFAGCGSEEDKGNFATGPIGERTDAVGSVTVEASNDLIEFAEAGGRRFGQINPDSLVVVERSKNDDEVITKLCQAEIEIGFVTGGLSSDQERKCDEQGVEFASVEAAPDGGTMLVRKGAVEEPTVKEIAQFFLRENDEISRLVGVDAIDGGAIDTGIAELDRLGGS
ncbi:MAG: hypothetical protein ACR2NA_04805 [Solirubrobacterales bacterium]